jgi:hypothetical protein
MTPGEIFPKMWKAGTDGREKGAVVGRCSPRSRLVVCRGIRGDAMRQIGRSSLSTLSGLALLLSAIPAISATIVVTSAADPTDAQCTLHDAITAANTNAAVGGCAAGAVGSDTITFNIPATDARCSPVTGVCTIKPAATLPEFTEPVLINGYSQPNTHANTLTVGDDAVLLIEIDATNLNPVFGFKSTSSGSTVRGLIINHINANGIYCQYEACANNLTIAGNFLGVDHTGTTVVGLQPPIYLSTSTGMTIGGSTPADRNIIGAGMQLSVCSNGTVQGNYFGVAKSGTTALLPAPTYALNMGNSDHIVVGGSVAGAGNVIGAWNADAINIHSDNSTLQPPHDNLIQGNFIGTNASGTSLLSPGPTGITIGNTFGGLGPGTGNIIGGSAPGAGNVIAGAGTAGIFLQTDEKDVVVQGNFIGTDVSGRLPLGNAIGVGLYGGSGTIGGKVAGSGNHIAFNATFGVSVSNATEWSVLGNDIYTNGALGISLSGATPTPNDDGDADTGANNRQNYPVLDFVIIGPKTTANISGSLNSTTSTVFRIEFFANAACDPSGNGQGKVYIGSHDVMTNPNDVAFGPLPFTVPGDRHVITATATDPNGNTSEFSNCAKQDTIFTDSYDGD